MSKKAARARARRDAKLAIILGVVVTVVVMVAARLTHASGIQTFSVDANQLAGGNVQRSWLAPPVRVLSETSPGASPVTVAVTASEVAASRQICMDYTVTSASTWLNIELHTAAGLTQSLGRTVAAGTGTECLQTGGATQGGTININVTPGRANIIRVYGL